MIDRDLQRDVRFWVNSGHQRATIQCLLLTQSRLLNVLPNAEDRAPLPVYGKRLGLDDTRCRLFIPKVTHFSYSLHPVSAEPLRDPLLGGSCRNECVIVSSVPLSSSPLPLLLAE
jgi:hypothetical protein